MGNTIDNTYTGIAVQALSDYNAITGNTLIVTYQCITDYDQGFRNNIIYNNCCIALYGNNGNGDNGNGDVAPSFSLEGVIMLSPLTIVRISITVIIFGVKRIKTFVEVKKSRLPKDEVARYKKLKEQERQKKRISNEFSDEVKALSPKCNPLYLL